VQLNLAIKAAYLLDFCRDEITFHIIVTDLQLVFLNASSLHTTGQVNGRQVKNGVLVRVDIDLPSGLIDGDDATDYHISNIRPVVAFGRTHADHTINQVDYACH